MRAERAWPAAWRSGCALIAGVSAAFVVACGGGTQHERADSGGPTSDAGKVDATADSSGAEDAGADAGDGSPHPTDASPEAAEGSAEAAPCPAGLTDSGVDPGSCIYDLAVQFTASVNGGANPWSYGQTAAPGGAFTAFTIHGGPDAGVDSGSAVPIIYGYGSVDPSVTVSGGNLIGWNGTDDDPSHPAGTAFYPLLLVNAGDSAFVLSSNSGAASGITALPGQILAGASPTNLVDARFTAPAPLGARELHARFDRLQVSPVTYSQTVYVVANGVTLFSQILSGNGGSVAFSSPVSLAAGDNVDFLIQSVPDFNGGAIAITGQVALPGFDAGTLSDASASDGAVDGASE
jgi:hypothetical protein